MKLEVIEDMFLTELAWTTMKPFVTGMRQKFGEDLPMSSLKHSTIAC